MWLLLPRWRLTDPVVLLWNSVALLRVDAFRFHTSSKPLLYENVNMRAALVLRFSAAASFNSHLKPGLGLNLNLKLDQICQQLIEVQHQHQDLLQLHAHLQALRPCYFVNGGTHCKVVVERAGPPATNQGFLMIGCWGARKDSGCGSLKRSVKSFGWGVWCLGIPHWISSGYHKVFK